MENNNLTCKYIKDESNGIYSKATCIIDNQLCGMTRFCRTLNSLVMSDLYKAEGCTIENKNKENIKCENNIYINIDNNKVKEGDILEEKIEVQEMKKETKKAPRKKVKDIVIDKETNEIKTQTCNIRMIHNNKVYFDFVGEDGNIYTLHKDIHDKTYSKTIIVEYQGKIGKSDFQIK